MEPQMRTADVYKAEMDVVLSLNTNRDSVVNAKDTSALVSNLLLLNRALGMTMRPPKSDTPERNFYDSVVRIFGNRDKAVSALNKAFADGLQNLYDRKPTLADLGPQAGRLKVELIQVQKLFSGGDGYYDCDSKVLSGLLKVLEGGRSLLVIPSKTVVGIVEGEARESLPYNPFSSVHITSVYQRDEPYVESNVVTANQISAFGKPKDDLATKKARAQAFSDTYKDVVVYSLQHKSDDSNLTGSGAEALRVKLLGLMGQIANQSVLNDPNYKSALQALGKPGGLKEALGYMNNNSVLAGIMQNTKQVVVVNASSRSITLWDCGVATEFYLGESWDTFKKWVGLNPTARNERIGITAAWQQLLGLGTAVQTDSTGKVTSQKVLGRGNAFNFGTQYKRDVFWLQQAAILEVFATFSVSDMKFDVPVTITDSAGKPQTRTVTVEKGSYGLSIYGARWISKSDPNKKEPIKLDSVGVAATGVPVENDRPWIPTNVIVWIGGRSDIAKGEKWNAYVLYTGEYSRFVETSRFGVSSQVVAAYQPSPNWLFRGDLLGKYELPFVGPRTQTIQGSAGLELVHVPSGLSLRVQGGLVTGIGGPEEIGLTPTAGVTLAWRPQPSSKGSRSVALSEVYGEAIDIADSPGPLAEGSRGRAVAQKLAIAISNDPYIRQISAVRIDPSTGKAVPKSADAVKLEDALKLLEDGKLKEGVAKLREIREFQVLGSRR